MAKRNAFHHTAAMMGMTPQVWARHANPWSGWSRLPVLPLLALAVWSRVWFGWGALLPVALLLLWTWLNPRVFPVPARTDNWMSEGVLGEQLWLQRSDTPALAHHRRVVHALTLGGLCGGLLYFAGLAVLHPGLTATGLAITMLTKLWMLDRMVWVLWDCRAEDET
ncbi:DUF6653 family protein [Tritonibacter scottomollicae]|uniref:DUF6653 family protein n=1 Tax=Tritonibacter scottomollicae TaxID=483013 RepID=A0ABZ0HJR9_TRISK|nr:DUF6653 family protein [Tritonibacter scottomollicae]WOI34919.1 DUF6653 family protein [Tritonibacter scottomollicae]